MASPFLGAQTERSTEEVRGLLSRLSTGESNKAIGLVSSLMWYLSRPYHAVTGGVSGLLEGDPVKAAEGLWGGLTGSKKDVYAGDLLGKLGIQKGAEIFKIPVLDIPVHTRDLLAAPLSFALDPLMYSKIGALSKIGKEREMAMGTMTAAGKINMGLQPTLNMQLKAGERIPFQMFGTEVPLISDVMRPILGAVGDTARWVRTRKFMQETFGEVTDRSLKQWQEPKDL